MTQSDKEPNSGFRIIESPTSPRLPVALYDKSGDSVLMFKSRTELKQMISTGEAIHVCKRCGMPEGAKRCNGVSAKKQPHQMIYAATELFRESHQSACYITEEDMLANVGIAGPSGYQNPPDGAAIKAAQDKIEAWPTVGDDKAVRVGPRIPQFTPCSERLQ